MTPRSDGSPARWLVTALATVWVLATGVIAASGTPAARTPAPPAASAPAQPANFVGDEACATCHEAEGKSLSATLHGKAQNVRTPAARTGQTCETCHGPG